MLVAVATIRPEAARIAALRKLRALPGPGGSLYRFLLSFLYTTAKALQPSYDGEHSASMAGLSLFVSRVWARAPHLGSRCVALLALLLLAAGCHLIRISQWFGGTSEIKVASVSPKMNHNSPVAVEVVFVYDQGVLDQLLAMDAKTWFAQREQIIRDHAGQGAFDSWQWEWVPGQSLQTIPAVPLEHKTGIRGGVIFASYSTPGSHRQRIDPELNILLTLGDTDFTVKQES